MGEIWIGLSGDQPVAQCQGDGFCTAGDAQPARPVLMGECRPVQVGVKRRTVPAYVQPSRVEAGADSKRPDVVPEYFLARVLNISGALANFL